MHPVSMSDLLTETLRLARTTTLAPREICDKAEVGYRWYCRFVNGDFDDPGVRKVERLYAVLSKKQYPRRRVAS